MHQKKRIVIIVAVLLLFVTAGGWYIGKTWISGAEPYPESVFKMAQAEPDIPLDITEVPVTDVPAESTDKSDIPVAVPVEKECLTVFICGEVISPGVYEFPGDARLYEVIEQAGGFTEQADKSYHNLARTVADGERIYILSLLETEELALAEKIKGEESPAPVTERAASGADNTGKKVNLNTAGLEELTTLPGIGEAKAESILEYRKRAGGFTAVEEVMNISGIGEAMFEKIKDRITVK